MLQPSNHKNYNFLDSIWLKNFLFSTNSLANGQFVIRQFVIGRFIIRQFNKPITLTIVLLIRTVYES